ncbi:hypothetical protein ACLOJK_029315 [Asimina triloba]
MRQQREREEEWGLEKPAQDLGCHRSVARASIDGDASMDAFGAAGDRTLRAFPMGGRSTDLGLPDEMEDAALIGRFVLCLAGCLARDAVWFIDWGLEDEDRWGSCDLELMSSDPGGWATDAARSWLATGRLAKRGCCWLSGSAQIDLAGH